MNQVFFPANSGQPCKAWYRIVLSKNRTIPSATIVVYQGLKQLPATSIFGSEEGRNSILNSVLEVALRGVRVEFIKFVAILGLDGRLEARDYAIHVDVDDYVARGNRHDVIQAPADDLGGKLLNLIGKADKRYSFWSGDVVGGCARFFLGDERGMHQGEAVDLLQAAQDVDAHGFKEFLPVMGAVRWVG